VEVRNNKVKAKRVLIEPAPEAGLRQSRTVGKLKIYDLDEDLEEEIVVTNQRATTDQQE
jgi:hypothetical protein